MVYRGKVKGGAIVLDPGVQLPDGAVVRIELELTGEPPLTAVDDPLSRMTDLAFDTGIPDLATNVDHYLYGHAKASDGG